MRIETDAFIAQQPPPVQEIIRQLCTDISLDEIRKAHTSKAAQVRDAMICTLGFINQRMNKITEVTGVDSEYARAVLSERRKFGVRVRTQRWAS